MVRLLIMLSLIFSISLSKKLNAQVTIGSGLQPASGALLDLKEGNRSAKGLALPRVKLINLKPTNSSAFAASIGDLGEWEMDKHIGLTVYNVIEGTGYCVDDSYTLENVAWKGIHIWDGTAWQLIQNTAANIETDVRTIMYHEVKNMDGIAVGSFTMRYEDEEETYYYADFGTAGTWMTQNLRTQYTPQGIRLEMTGVQTDTGKEAGTDNLLKRGAYPSSVDVTDSSYYDLNRSNGKEVGLLYDWFTATDHHNCSKSNQAQVGLLSAPNPTPGAFEVETKEPNKFIRGICPEGWHIPSDREWTQLEKYLTENASRHTQDTPTPNGVWNDTWETVSADYRGTISGTVMKSKINVENSSQATNGNSKTEQNGGFNAYQTGAKVFDSSDLSSYGTLAYIWSSSNATSGTSWYRAVTSAKTGTFKGHTSRRNFFSVRCKKNE